MFYTNVLLSIEKIIQVMGSILGSQFPQRFHKSLLRSTNL